MTTSLQLSYGGVFLAVLANQLCLPVPSIVFLMAAGALSAHGQMHPGIVVCLGVSGCLTGDGIWFWAGRKWGSKAMRVLCGLTPDPRRCAQNAREKFSRYGLPVLCVSKFLPGLDAVMPPLGGSQGVSVSAFLAHDAAGSLLWSASYVGLGYLFSSQLDLAIRWAQQFGTVLGLAIGVPIAVYAGLRGLALVRMIRQLRLRRMSPRLLARKLKSNSKIAVLDLANFEEETGSKGVEAIPGAFSVDPILLRKSPNIIVPDDFKIVLYCSSGSNTVSARTALALERIGINNVWVLEGGLKAWREQGFPVAQSLEGPEAVAERFGVRLPKPSRKGARLKRGPAILKLNLSQEWPEWDQRRTG